MQRKIKVMSILLMAFLFFLFIIAGCVMKSKNNSFGLFESASDIGNVKHTGASVYDAMSDQYRLKGSGTNMWFDKDEFHFLWKRYDGDFQLYTWLEFMGEGVDPHRKAGLMIRKNLESGSPYISAAYHAGDGLIAMQYRLHQDSLTHEIKSKSTYLPILQMIRNGKTVKVFGAKEGDLLQAIGKLELELDWPEAYVGLFVCSHNPDVIEEAIFKNTRLTIPAKSDFKPYQDYIGSRLEVLNIETGIRKAIHEIDGQLEAPNWSRDGKFLVLNRKGLLYRIPSEGGKLELIDSDFANANNNDHGFSPDGTQLAISHHAEDRPAGMNSMIYTLPVEGGVPKQITDKSPSYWHGWSPDGQYLIYTAFRNNQWDLYRISIHGGEEYQLTNNNYLDDGSEYSIDGKHIWFNSNRTGTMEIWKMQVDGSNQTQITDDAYQNWFPHQSPDGKWLVFLSYPKEVESGDHPYYKSVMLRLMDVRSGEIKVIAHLNGGQGTINVPSWSPDSKKIAFISNSKMERVL